MNLILDSFGRKNQNFYCTKWLRYLLLATHMKLEIDREFLILVPNTALKVKIVCNQLYSLSFLPIKRWLEYFPTEHFAPV